MTSIKTTLKTKIGGLIERNPVIGKVFASLMGSVEVLMLDTLHFIGDHFTENFIIRFMRTFLNGRWGGRVIPLNINIPSETRYLARQEILEIISRSKVQRIAECYCRTKHQNCDNPTHTCMILSNAPGRSLHDIDKHEIAYKNVSKGEIINILNDCDDRGLVHQVIYFPSPNYYYVICNCCTCCCEGLHNYKHFLSPKIVKSDFLAVTDLTKCKTHGDCVSICPFDARKLDKNGKLKLDMSKCFGCGLCIRKILFLSREARI